MKRFALAVVLTCVLSGSVLAGDAHSVGAPAPVTPPSSIAAGVVLTILSLIR